MKIQWKRVLIAAIVAEFALYASGAEEAIYYVALFGLMFLGGLWVASKIESRFVLHGVLVAIAANILFIIYCLPWVLTGQLPREVFKFFAIKIAGAAMGGYIGERLRKKSPA